MKHTELDVDTIAEDPENPNAMREDDYSKLVKAIDEVGFLQPILVKVSADGKDFVCVDGHHRLSAARSLGYLKVPAVVLEEGDPGHARSTAVQIGMNKLRGELDLGSIAATFAGLVEEGWSVADLEITGFSEEEIAELVATTQMDVDADDLLQGTAGAMPSTEEVAPKPFLLEVLFASKEDYQACRRAIKRAGGKGAELADGLKILCGVDD